MPASAGQVQNPSFAKSRDPGPATWKTSDRSSAGPYLYSCWMASTAFMQVPSQPQVQQQNAAIQQHSCSHLPNETMVQQSTESTLVPPACADMAISLEFASELQLPRWCMMLLRDRNLAIAAALLQNSMAAWALVHKVLLLIAERRHLTCTEYSSPLLHR